MAGGKKSESPFKSMTLKIEVYLEFERLKKLEEASLGVSDLSWTDYIAIVVKKLKEAPSGKSR